MDNTNRFTGRAADYDRYRQRYPSSEVLNRLCVWCGLTPAWLVADVGAGTGMLAEVFLENGNRVLAVEPNPDMRKQMRACVEGQLGRPVPQLEVIDATAEATTLHAASVDLVAIGRAFHWFDKDRALAEFRRILRPGGWVALVAADRDRDSKDPAFRPQIDAYEEMMTNHGIDYTRVSAPATAPTTRWRCSSTVSSTTTNFPACASSTGPPFAATLCRSRSHRSPATPTTKRSSAQLRRHFDTYARDGIFIMPTIMLDYRRSLPSLAISRPEQNSGRSA